MEDSDFDQTYTLLYGRQAFKGDIGKVNTHIYLCMHAHMNARTHIRVRTHAHTHNIPKHLLSVNVTVKIHKRRTSLRHSTIVLNIL